jgi:hypothetical protein
MSTRRLKFAAHDHYGRALVFISALQMAGHERVELDEPADLLLIDLDPPEPLPHRRVIDFHREHGAKIVLYPHGGGGPSLAYDGLYEPYEHVDLNLVAAYGHAEFMRRIGSPHAVQAIGWSYCRLAPFRACEDVRRVVFAPMHPNGDGSLAEVSRQQNADVFRRLLETPYELTVRHIGTLEQNGLWEVEGVEYVNGRTTAETREIDAADAVVAGDGTFPTLALARGVPTVVYAQARGMSLGFAGEKLIPPQRLELYRDYIRHPFDVEDGPLEEVVAAAARSEDAVATYKRRFIGPQFDPRAFVALIERTALGVPAPPRIDPTRAVTTLAFAEELVERPELLAAYAATVGPDDDASLLLWAPAADSQLLLELAEQAIEAAGIDVLPDILLAPLPGGPATEQALAARADALLGEWPRVGALGELPSFDAALVA